MFALLNDALDTPVQYPFDVRRFYKKVLQRNYNSSADVVADSGGRVVPVQPTAKPADSHTYQIRQTMPVKNGSVWEQAWTTDPLPAPQQTRKLNLAKLALWEKVAAKGEALQTGTYSFGPGEFNLSGRGYARIVGYAAVPGARTVPIGPDANGVERFFDANAVQVAALVVAVFGLLDDVVARMSALKDSISAATDFTELAAIDINAGWPANS